MTKTVSEEEEKKICNAYDRGYPTRSILKSFKINFNTLYKILRRNKVETRSKHPNVLSFCTYCSMWIRLSQAKKAGWNYLCPLCGRKIKRKLRSRRQIEY
jgi:predicted RNA-binding Zn-ribbon protein involved in translation (DUF1610 family)